MTSTFWFQTRPGSGNKERSTPIVTRSRPYVHAAAEPATPAPDPTARAAEVRSNDQRIV